MTEIIAAALGAAFGSFGAWMVMVFQKRLEIKNREDDEERQQRLRLLFVSRQLDHRYRMALTVYNATLPKRHDPARCIQMPALTKPASCPRIDLSLIMFLAETEHHKLLSDLIIIDGLQDDLARSIDAHRNMRATFAADPSFLTRYDTTTKVIAALGINSPEHAALQLLDSEATQIFDFSKKGTEVFKSHSKQFFSLSSSWRRKNH